MGDRSADPPPIVLRGETFDAFYRHNFRSLVALVLVLSGSRAAAEDIAQDALLTVLRDWDRVSALEDPAAWVRRVTLNRACSVSRRRMAELRALARLGGRREPLAAMPEVDEQVWAEVRRLPRRQGQCVALHYLLDCSVAETARTLGCAEGTVKAHLHQARISLANRLGTDGGRS